MKEFISHIRKSIFDPAYYQELLDRRASFSWKYYASFAMLLATFMTIAFSVPLIPQLNRVLREAPAKLFDYYPDELTIRIDRGHVSTNVTEPYFLPIPTLLRDEVGSNSPFSYLAVIDTRTPVTIEQFQSYHAYFWISEHSIATLKGETGMQVNTLAPDVSMTINEAGVRSAVTALEPYVRYAAPVLVVMIFGAFAIGFLLNLIYLIIAALFVFLLGRFLRRNWSYGTAYRISLHAVTLPLLLQQLLRLLPFGYMVDLPFLFTIILLGVVVANYPKVSPEPAPLPPDESTSLSETKEGE